MIIGYLDMCQKNIGTEEQRQIITQYAEDSSLIIDVFSAGDDICQLSDTMRAAGNTILIANITGLGHKLPTIKENLKMLFNKGLTLISVKEGFVIEPTSETNWLIKGLEMSIDIRNSMMSTITRNALNEKRASGCKLGRSFGSTNKKRIWDGKEETIKAKLLSGLSRKRTAQDVGISIVSLYNFLKQNPEIARQINGE